MKRGIDAGFGRAIEIDQLRLALLKKVFLQLLSQCLPAREYESEVPASTQLPAVEKDLE